MTNAGEQSDVYTHGHHASVVGQHARRTAEDYAAYLLPRLRPGMRVLDVGCGPGSITVGLARAVAPAEVIGIDVSDDVLEQARAAAAEAGLAIRYEHASTYALPYDDDAFDVAHAHQVLQHLAHPVDALREMARVVRPGGLIAVKDADYATMVGWPHSAAIDRWLDVYHQVAARNDADADAGRRIPAWLHEAGLDDVELFPTVQLYADRDAVANWGNSWAERVLHSSLGEQAVAYGIATPADLEAIAEGWRAWARTDGALFMFTHMAAIARVP